MLRPSNLPLVALVLALCACEATERPIDHPSPTSPEVAGGSPTSANSTASATAAATATGNAAAASAPPKPLAGGGAEAVEGRRGMVTSEDPLAAQIGAEVLAQGGNAVDAVYAMGYALAVTHHVAGSLGGGGFMIVRLADGTTKAVDFREIAPAKATVALNEKQLAEGAHGYLSAPVPGVVGGLELAHERFGSQPRAALIEPAIALAEDGHRYGERQSIVLNWFWKRLSKHDGSLRALLGREPAHDQPIQAGHLLKQRSLAKTLRAVRDHGKDGFYAGEVAEKIAKAHADNGGVLTVEDLAKYEAKLRDPLTFDYRGYTVHTMPPPSMGGVAVLSILSTLAAHDPHGDDLATQTHLFIEAARRAYADRRAIGADPDMVDPAIDAALRRQLLDPDYYRARQPPIDLRRATPSSAVTPIQDGAQVPDASPETTHLSVVDAQGNAVSCTITLSHAFGAWVVVPGTGVLLSSAMGAFSPDGANTLAPHKRMASSMSPSIVVAGDRVTAVVGSPGGDTIPNSVAQVIRNLVDRGMTIDQAVAAPRVHHQYKPDEVRTEAKNPLPAAVLKDLQARGHTLRPNSILIGDANAIVVDADGVAWGYADTRKGGLAVAPGAGRKLKAD